MQAVIKTGGKQYIVEKGQTLQVELVGDHKKVEFEALMTIDGDKIAVGRPVVKDVVVKAEVLEAVKGDKVRVLKFKAKKRVKRLTGHRQKYSQIRIVSIG
jgi:large subunit ribosomal protein L21